MCEPTARISGGRVLAGALVVAAGAAGLLWLVALLVEYAAVIFAAGGLAAAAGVAFVVRELRTAGRMWRPEPAAVRVRAVRRSALPPAREVPAIEAPRPARRALSVSGPAVRAGLSAQVTYRLRPRTAAGPRHAKDGA